MKVSGHRRMLCFLLAIAAAFAPSFASDAFADVTAPSLLRVERSPSAQGCPTVVQLAGSVGLLVGRIALRTRPGEEADTTFDVRFDRQRSHYTALLRLSGAGSGERLFEDPGETCAGLWDALALAIAIAVDEPLILDAPPARTEPLPPKPLPPSAPDASDPGASKGDVPAGMRVYLRTEGGVAGGMLAAQQPVLQAHVRLAWPSFFSLGGGALWLSPASKSVPPGEVDLSLIAAVAQGCARLLGQDASASLALCLAVSAGSLRARGRSFAPARSGASLWGGVGGALEAQGGVTRFLGWCVSLAVWRSLREQALDVEGLSPSTVLPRTGLLGTVGIRWSIF